MGRHSSQQRASLPVVFITLFIDLLGFGIVLPLLPYYAHQFHASAVTVGALIASYSAMQFVCAPVWGRWSDRIGRRPIMLISLAGSTCSYALFAAADGIGLLFVSRVLAGVAGANIPVAQAFIADSTNEEERARGMGLIGAAFGLGFVFGPAIGGFLAQYGHRAPGLAATVICGINLLAALWWLPESLPPAQRQQTRPAARFAQLRDAFRHPRLARLIVVFAAVVFSFSTMETTLALLCATAYGMSASHIYWLFGYMGVLITLMQGGLIGGLSQRIDEISLVVIGAGLLAAGLGAAPFAPPLAPLLIALAAIAFGQGMTSPVLSSLISKSSRENDRGGVLGISQSVGSLARILGPLWGGMLFDHAGPAGPYVTTAALMLVAAGVALSLPHRVVDAADSRVELKARL